MPLYFFQLSFGSRVLPDEEGVELRDRAAAREEAHAIIRELTDRTGDGTRRRWASWFLEVNDEVGRFLRLPIGYPALELVPNNASEPPSHRPQERPHRREELPSPRPAIAEPPRPATVGHPLSRLVRQIAARLERTAQLLERNRELRQELSSQFLRSRQICDAARQVVSSAQGSSAQALPLKGAPRRPDRHSGKPSSDPSLDIGRRRTGDAMPYQSNGTFSEGGEFTFEPTIKGRPLQKG